LFFLEDRGGRDDNSRLENNPIMPAKSGGLMGRLIQGRGQKKPSPNGEREKKKREKNPPLGGDKVESQEYLMA